MTNWLLRLLKGAFIGSGFILPGVSGGALAAVFGLYERMIMFMANFTKNFKENILFFLPVGLGSLGGIFMFSLFLSYFFEFAKLPLTWFFIGCIAGTLPTLWQQAAKKEKRKALHIVSLATSLIAGIIFLRHIEAAAGGMIPLNTYTWAMAGSIIALGVIVPGLSPSNLLLFLQMYEPMVNGISSLNLSIIIPLSLGGLLTILALANIMAYIFKQAHALLFHIIIGFVIASTLLIIPLDQNHTQSTTLLSLASTILGILLAQWMCRLDKR